ncbi:MAG: xanthine dehydrogenase YagS FAD-binding subunit [Chloroflexota bacterium]|nr:xanthine dehydrogenase YagS FAD-binding subunit [Chloroflexota bacterium]
MRPIRHLAVESEEAALATLAGHPGEAAWLAGGTNLLDMLKLDVETAAVLVDINALPLRGVAEVDGGRLRIGALARNSDVAHHPAVRRRLPMLSEALLAGASVQLRNMATVGGNLMQRTRCSYFRDIAMPCNRREPGTGCGARDGHHRGHAVLGTSPACIAVHPSDMCVALAALDATVSVRGPAGARTIPIAELHRLPGDHPEIETALEHGELITAVEVPPLPWAAGSRYLKVRDRAAYAFALVSAAVALDLDGGAVRDARIALGGVGTVPWRSPEAEAALRGRPANAESFALAAAAALRHAAPLRDNVFKVELARRVLVRCLRTVAGGAGGGA